MKSCENNRNGMMIGFIESSLKWEGFVFAKSVGVRFSLGRSK